MLLGLCRSCAELGRPIKFVLFLSDLSGLFSDGEYVFYIALFCRGDFLALGASSDLRH